MEKFAQRIERVSMQGIPKTVWHTEYLEKDGSPNCNADYRDRKALDFHWLRILGPLSSEDPTMPGFFAEECRACTGKFIFRATTATATILTGKPISNRYEAISYVWGKARPLLIYCRCGMKKSVPISGPERFGALLSLAASAGASDGVWLDALSIDQDDAADKKCLIGAMGEIYKNAGSVLVLLPSADNFLFDCLVDLRNGVIVQDYMGLSDYEAVKWDTFGTSNSTLVDGFISGLEDFKRKLEHSVYFGRAWTFQEWALAREVHVACEGVGSQADSIDLIPQMKSGIIRATVRLAMHRLRLGHYGIQCKIRKADMPAWIDEVKALFPQEDIFCSSEEIDWEERRMDIEVPHTGMNSALGLRLLGKHPPFIQTIR
ncbi:MAG: hypothetical protein L6R42_002426 [Xanthoria sp. 1 TBL-2021]|nr:MAG: hypothetical protein L6R42_002426 [Xanthoria sp. 1 TBL-2021]